MTTIENLFDESRDLHRAIEKVITFGVDQEERLGNEIREYIVTEHMEAEFEDLLTKMQIAMERGGCLLYTSPSPRDQRGSRMPSSA